MIYSTFLPAAPLKKDCKRFVNTCHECQVIGKPNQKIPKAPLCPLSIVSEPFSEVQMDTVGSLPRTRHDNEYIWTIRDKTSYYPDAIPGLVIKFRKSDFAETKVIYMDHKISYDKMLPKEVSYGHEVNYSKV